MISASPEYAITKPPGMAHHLSRKRDRPLRTYGKRSTATPEPRGEPPTKRARTEDKEPETKASESPAETPESSAGNDSRPHKEVAARRAPSILNYFKPVPRPQEASPPRQRAESADAEPAQARPKRRTRLLRIRATSSPLSDAVDAEARPPAIDSSGDGHGDGRGRTADGADEHSPGRGPLHDGGENLVNQARPEDVAAKVGARARPPTVQTTLNISAQAAFAECKVCDTVWNPLYPDDVKYHAKRHAAVAKAKRKGDGL
ncbi:hypothetical protein JDV02_003907 [Purpureocillium takamizusanense]|uniref:N-acetyltransferase ESCO zinc-finger domain-containing protein n=1 Tax=Purpureocillium takamizusanense TaxID=2060973 RepID=A0A9Q8QDB9_9HYPO|nr:uncharacterized protein JDV02_003907 [Purpureocillium takamizusanense]UNI17575.1 hypothetical protein JDV02_003907 [Purpureocillium takamizusanense]